MWPFRRPSRVSRNTTLGLILVLLALGLFTLPNRTNTRRLPRCLHDPIADNVVVAVKTGATEASEKIPMLMQTSLRCAKHVLFFSDLEQDIGPYHLYDVLDTISPSVMENSDFDFYREQRKVWSRDGNITALKTAKDPKSPNNLAAWTLDKYKNIHLVEKTWELKPEKDWYIFIDADTYIVWSNLLRWLTSLESSKKSWYGAQVFVSGTEFSHGGSGTVLSRSTVHDLAVTHNGTAARWDPMVYTECCGDLMLGKALAEYGNTLVNLRPLMSGQKPATMPFFHDYWCLPTVTMHHFSSSDMAEFHAYERGRPNQSTPIRPENIFVSLVSEPLRLMSSVRDDWDNVSWKRELGSGLAGGEDEKIKTESTDVCADACRANAACFQYAHDGETCFIGKAIRLGEKREPENGKRWRSGWRQDKIADWISNQKPCEGSGFSTLL